MVRMGTHTMDAGSVREMEMADCTDSDMSESEGSQGERADVFTPTQLFYASLGGDSSSGAGSLAIDICNALTLFLTESSTISTSSYSNPHYGHGRSHSARASSQTVKDIMPGPLSFVLPQNRRSTSAPGAPTTPPMPSDLYPSVPSVIKIFWR